MSQLIPIENVNAIEVFKDDKTLANLLSEIKKTATDFKPDTSTDKGRKEIASQAYKVSQSKTVIDKAGKELTEEWLRKKREVDSGRKTARDFCDNLRDEIRQPLTEWEAQQQAEAEAAALKAKVEADEIEAYAQNDLIDREAKVREAEARIAAEEAEKARIKAEQKAEAERKEREERIRKEAAEQAAKEAEAALQAEKDRVANAEREAKEAAERAKQAEIEAAKQAERERLQAIKDTEDRVERERVEAERLAQIERDKEEKKAKQKRHVAKIHNGLIDSLVGAVKCTPEEAKAIVIAIASGKIPRVSINYLEERKAA